MISPSRVFGQSERKSNTMIKHLVLALILMLAVLDVAKSMPLESSATITKDTHIDLPGNERINKRSADDLGLDWENHPIPIAITRDTKIDLPGSERIAKRSAEDYLEPSSLFLLLAVTRDLPVELPGNEKINKRSPEDYETSQQVDDDDYSTEYESSDQGTPYAEFEALESNEDFLVAESRQRTARSVEEVEDELEAAESGLVFRPLFRSRDRYELKKRVKRSAEDVKTKPVVQVIETDDEDLEGAENVVFQPMFRRRLRPVRDVLDVKGLKGDVQGRDDMEAAENGLIFRPLFRNRQRDF